MSSFSPVPKFDLCFYFSRPTPVVRWLKEGGELPANRTFFENFKKTLKIIDVSEADSGNYKCIARNILGSAHHVISVTVKGNTKIILNVILSMFRMQD